jgi:hypothetical protein
LETEKANFLSSKRKNREGNAYDQTTLERLARLKSLTEQVEQPAQSAEVEIWRELASGQKVRQEKIDNRVPSQPGIRVQ